MCSFGVLGLSCEAPAARKWCPTVPVSRKNEHCGGGEKRAKFWAVRPNHNNHNNAKTRMSGARKGEGRQRVEDPRLWPIRLPIRFRPVAEVELAEAEQMALLSLYFFFYYFLLYLLSHLTLHFLFVLFLFQSPPLDPPPLDRPKFRFFFFPLPPPLWGRRGFTRQPENSKRTH